MHVRWVHVVHSYSLDLRHAVACAMACLGLVKGMPWPTCCNVGPIGGMLQGLLKACHSMGHGMFAARIWGLSGMSVIVFWHEPWHSLGLSRAFPSYDLS